MYFPVDGFISLVTRIDGQPGLEVGMVGREGMLGRAAGAGRATAPLHALVQGPGAAWRVGAAALQARAGRNAALQRGLNRYLYVLMAQLAARRRACVFT